MKRTVLTTLCLIWFCSPNVLAEPAGLFEQSEVRDMVPPNRWEDAILVLRASDQEGQRSCIAEVHACYRCH